MLTGQISLIISRWPRREAPLDTDNPGCEATRVRSVEHLLFGSSESEKQRIPPCGATLCFFGCRFSDTLYYCLNSGPEEPSLWPPRLPRRAGKTLARAAFPRYHKDMKTLRNYWLNLPIRGKMHAFILFLVLGLLAGAAVNNYAMRYATRDVGRILLEITRCANAQEAMQQEETAFRAYVREKNENNRKRYEQACVHMKSSLDLLPDRYEQIGNERCARTWNIRNMYETYEKLRDAAAAQDMVPRDGNPQDDASQAAVEKLYEVYTLQTYLRDYLRALSQLTTEAGSTQYEAKYPVLQSLVYLLGAASIAIILMAVNFSRVFSETMLTPLIRLARSVRRVSAGDFGEADLIVPNKDELGELVSAFNGMKHATEEHINTLQENQELSEKLHREELTRADMERRLDAARLSLLQSQVNPHFLFNTLNTIAGMAELEEAETTDRMIRSLANIFRYNLRTTEQFVSLTQELSVIRDYMYLQQMRFGERLKYEQVLETGVDPDLISVPAFTLQPLVENSVGHGLSRMERGGVIRISVSEVRTGKTGDSAGAAETGADVPAGSRAVRIVIADNGMGMTPERLAEVREALEEARSRETPEEEKEGNAADVSGAQDSAEARRRIGIGVGNIYRRIYSLYRTGSMTIESREGKGTEITLVIPQEEGNVPDSDRG